MSPASALYEGWVTHRRHRPVQHEFRYRLFLPLLDLAELPGAARVVIAHLMARPDQRTAGEVGRDSAGPGERADGECLAV